MSFIYAPSLLAMLASETVVQVVFNKSTLLHFRFPYPPTTLSPELFYPNYYTTKTVQIYIKYCIYAKKIVLLRTISDFFNKNIANMTKKGNQPKTKIGVVLLTLFLAAVIVAGLLFGTIRWLRHYTQHGIEITVPNIIGMFPEEAQVTLAAAGLQLVVIDSTFSQKTRLGTFIEQNPRANSKVKEGRVIYAIQNACMRRPVTMPELRDFSLRQAESRIKALGMVVGTINYEPSAYKNIIIDMRIDNVPILAGTPVPEGSVIDLYVGKGLGNQQVTVPSLIGKTLTEARSWLIGNSLTVGKIQYDEQPTEETLGLHIVYSQSPASGTVVVGGTSINLELTTDLEKAVTTGTLEEEEEFF